MEKLIVSCVYSEMPAFSEVENQQVAFLYFQPAYQTEIPLQCFSYCVETILAAKNRQFRVSEIDRHKALKLVVPLTTDGFVQDIEVHERLDISTGIEGYPPNLFSFPRAWQLVIVLSQ